MKFLYIKRFALILIIIFVSSHVQALTLKIATLSPEGSMWMKKMRAGAKTVEKQTQNRVKFKFYPGGVMGSDKSVLRKIRIGQLHGGAVVAGSLSNAFPGNQIYGQPMKFESQGVVDYVREHMDSYIVNGLEDAGFIIFGLAGGGFAYIMSNEPIATLDELRAQKVWIPDDNEVTNKAVKAFGISPIPLALSDVRTGLQTGLINTVTTSPVAAIVLQWHTQVKYLTDIPFVYLYATLAISKKTFKKILPEDQKIVKKEMTNAFKQIDLQNREDDFKAMETLKNRGITIVKPSPKALKEFKNKAMEASKIFVKSGLLSQDAVNQLDKHILDYQSNIAKSNDQ